MAPANLGMICIHNFTAILLIVAYFIEGFRSDALIESFLPILVLTVLYIPIARLMGRAVLSQSQSSLPKEERAEGRIGNS